MPSRLHVELELFVSCLYANFLRIHVRGFVERLQFQSPRAGDIRRMEPNPPHRGNRNGKCRSNRGVEFSRNAGLRRHGKFSGGEFVLARQ